MSKITKLVLAAPAVILAALSAWHAALLFARPQASLVGVDESEIARITALRNFLGFGGMALGAALVALSVWIVVKAVVDWQRLKREAKEERTPNKV